MSPLSLDVNEFAKFNDLPCFNDVPRFAIDMSRTCGVRSYKIKQGVTESVMCDVIKIRLNPSFFLGISFSTSPLILPFKAYIYAKIN